MSVLVFEVQMPRRKSEKTKDKKKIGRKTVKNLSTKKN